MNQKKYSMTSNAPNQFHRDCRRTKQPDSVTQESKIFKTPSCGRQGLQYDSKQQRINPSGLPSSHQSHQIQMESGMPNDVNDVSAPRMFLTISLHNLSPRSQNRVTLGIQLRNEAELTDAPSLEGKQLTFPIDQLKPQQENLFMVKQPLMDQPNGIEKSYDVEPRDTDLNIDEQLDGDKLKNQTAEVQHPENVSGENVLKEFKDIIQLNSVCSVDVHNVTHSLNTNPRGEKVQCQQTEMRSPLENQIQDSLASGKDKYDNHGLTQEDRDCPAIPQIQPEQENPIKDQPIIVNSLPPIDQIQQHPQIGQTQQKKSNIQRAGYIQLLEEMNGLINQTLGAEQSRKNQLPNSGRASQVCEEQLPQVNNKEGRQQLHKKLGHLKGNVVQNNPQQMESEIPSKKTYKNNPRFAACYFTPFIFVDGQEKGLEGIDFRASFLIELEAGFEIVSMAEALKKLLGEKRASKIKILVGRIQYLEVPSEIIEKFKEHLEFYQRKVYYLQKIN